MGECHIDGVDGAATLDRILDLGRQRDWDELARVFGTGSPLTPTEGRTRAYYLMSFVGRLSLPGRVADSIIGWGLGRWWQGHRFTGGGHAGISNTAEGFRPVWRILIPWYRVVGGSGGDEVFDFRVLSRPSSTDPSLPVSRLEWLFPDHKVRPRPLRPVQRFFYWFSNELTCSELVEFGDDGPILARISWRVPGGSTWRVTSYYCHRKLWVQTDAVNDR